MRTLLADRRASFSLFILSLTVLLAAAAPLVTTGKPTV